MPNGATQARRLTARRAAERTFLAWLRTSLAFASIGIAVTQLFRLPTGDAGDDAALRRLGRPLGATFLAISILALVLGFRRYVHGQGWLVEGKFPASRGSVLVVAALGLALVMAALFLILLIRPSGEEL